MRKVALFLFLNCITCFIAVAQHTITGKVIDENTQPLEFVVLTVMQNDNTVREEVVKEQGEFAVTLPEGTYSFNIIYFGKIILTREVAVTQSVNLGALQATIGSLTLGEFVLEDTKNLIERKVDRLVFNVENTVAASGGDAMDLLKVTPRVKVENDKIAMIGKSGMSVMIDDRIVQLSGEELVNYLKNIPSDNIKIIEVITNPPAKYSAEGNSGLINIKLKKSIEDSWSASIGGRHHQATYAKETIAGSFNFKKKKVSLYSNVNYTKGSNAYVVNTKVYYPDFLWEEIDNGKYNIDVLSSKLGLDYKVSDKFTTGFLINTSNNFPTIDIERATAYFINNSTQEADSTAVTQAETNDKRYNYIINYHLIFKVDTLNRKLSLDVDYFNHYNKTDRVFESETILANDAVSNGSFLSGNNIGDQNIENYSINLDMAHPFKWIIFNYGGRITHTQTNSQNDYYDLTSGTAFFDKTQSNTFTFNESTQAIYFSAQKEISEKWEAKAGIRVENTKTTGYSLTLNQTDKNEYTKLFPTTYLSYVPNDSNSFSISYGKRINRPYFSKLNPFKWINSSYSYSEGNPYLKPSYSHNLEFEYLYKDFWVNTLYFSRLENGWEEVAIIDTINRIQQYIPQNFINTTVIGLNEDITLKPYKWLRTNLSIDVYYNSATSTIPTTLNLLKVWNGVFSLSNDFILNKTKTAFFNINYFYVSKGGDNLDESSAYDQLSTTLKLLFFKKKLQVSLAVNDLFKGGNSEYSTYSNDLKTTFQRNDDSRYFRVAASYNFGNSNIRNAKRNNKNTEEINRSN